MNNDKAPEHVETIVIGGGQAGLSVGYHLARLGRAFLILEGNPTVGDTWRNRWDSLRLFTPARYDGLDGLRVPAAKSDFITKDEMAAYLEQYVKEFNLPVRTGIRVERLGKQNGRFELRTNGPSFIADQVVVATGHYQSPRVPLFATELDPSIRQLHSIEYRNPSQLEHGGVLVVGAGNSGAEIAKEVAHQHPTWLSGRAVGQIPFRVSSFLGQHLMAPLVLRGLFHRVLTVRTPIGRRMRPNVLKQGGPLIRVKRKELARLGVEFTGRTVGAKEGKPVLDDGRTLDVTNVIWCTGFHPGFSWIDLPVLGEQEPRHERGVVKDEPGLYFVGLEFQYSMSSTMVHGVGRDARYIAERVAKRHAELEARQRTGATVR